MTHSHDILSGKDSSEASTSYLGQFTIQGVAPGDYVLFAWRSNAEPAYAEPDFLERYKASGKALHVEEGASVAVILDSIL